MTFAEKLNNLHSRQTDHTISVEDALSSSVEKSLYEGLGDSKQFSAKKKGEAENAQDYAVDSMKEIPTAPSYEAGEKIKKHLKEKLPSYGFNPDFKYQGSVICNTHIKYHSDIDLLVLIDRFITVERPDDSFAAYKGNVIEDMQALRNACYAILKEVYSVPEIDNNGEKSIKIKKGGVLKRDIDVVPANWFDSVKYKKYGKDYLRGVQVFNKTTCERTKNFPFLNKKLIDDKDKLCNGNYRALVRLAKNLKVDSDSTAQINKISSYDIQSIFFAIENTDINNLTKHELVKYGYDYLFNLVANTETFRNIKVPDETRLVSEKVSFAMLKSLYDEFDELYNKIRGF